jgi:hypothetical protein
VLLGTPEPEYLVKSAAEPGQSFFRSGLDWNDMYFKDETANFCIKGLTTKDLSTWAEGVVDLPARFALRQNYPNPFNPSTTIEYVLPKTARVTLKLYNLQGAEVATLVDWVEQPGEKSVVWDARDKNGRQVPTGVYVYRLRVGSEVLTGKMTFVQ